MRTAKEDRYWILAGAIAAFVVATYLAFEAFGLGQAYQVDPATLGKGSWAALAMLLLIADVLLPVPSSLVMVANGAVFGVAAGAVLSIAGRVGAFAVGYLVGSLGLRRFGPADGSSAERLLSDRAWIGIAFTRPMPVLSETVAILAGAAALPFGRSLFAAFMGSIPESLILAAAGTAIPGGDSTWLVFISLAVIVSIYWIGVRIARARAVERA